MRIMIVDDEVIIRTGLAQVIQWEALGFELLEPAASAEEALGRMPRERPNIVLTDIRMTGKTGLQLAEEAKRIVPEAEVIILSGYDDFEYMQQAIRQDVSDYLLKTSRPEEIIKTVLRAKRRIEERWAVHSRDLFKNKEARNRLFERWVIAGDMAGMDQELQAGLLSRLLADRENGEDGLLQIVLVAAEGWDDAPASESLLLFAVENMLGDLLVYCETLVQDKRIVAAIRCKSGIGCDSHHFRAVMDKIERMLKCSLFVAAGMPVEKPEQLPESYAAADYAFGYRALLKEKMVEYTAVRQRIGGKTVCTHEEELELSSILLDNDAIALKEWVGRYIQSQLDDPQMTLESLEASVRSVAVSAHRWLERVMSATGRGGALEAKPTHLQLGRGMAPRDALFPHLYSVMTLYHHRYADGKTTHAQKAMAYIEEHLGGDVGLAQVAKHVHLHPSHLSEVFKKETGMTFGDYVTKQRMRRAMEILSVSPAKVSEVAAEVGYEDVKYFGQIFKKYTGKTPSEYRDKAGSPTNGE
ncbi:helix-turn-helix domain-containing protein [Paenibacillus allorhizosphaerae]|uniref:HTH-type transcriptional activator RhaR n=1 Tax=Paenibacillus allorhizosphaerae TaxID=2849866 RepID=A0ABN7TUU8_9BACL|nr:helix-turn-helix domain-containing protein [Paenibacillus allorhizosphaerae]CAG7655873.1 HTH-type transcriptional activator RhaR [Paenibacillus allorhizosphaerae]